MSDCGECTVCCTYLRVDTSEFSKEPNVSCEHLTEKGCSIYDDRFKICKEYKCFWLQVRDKYPEFNLEWRPDKVGLIVSTNHKEYLDKWSFDIIETKDSALDLDKLEPYMDVIFDLAGKQPGESVVTFKKLDEDFIRVISKN